MQVSAVSAASNSDAFREHVQDFIELAALKRAVRRSSADEFIEIVFAPFFVGARCYDLLCQDIERGVRNDDAVKLAAANGTHQRPAFHQLVARHREDPSLRSRAPPVAGAPNTLQGYSDRARRSHHAGKLHVPNINAQLERSRCDKRAHLAVFQLAFSFQAQLACKRSVVRSNRVFTQALGQMMRHSLDQPSRVHENQGRAMLLDQLRDAIVNLIPLAIRSYWPKLRRRHLDREIERALVPNIDNGRQRPIGADQESRDFLQRLLRRREPNEHRPAAATSCNERVEPLE